MLGFRLPFVLRPTHQIYKLMTYCQTFFPLHAFLPWSIYYRKISISGSMGSTLPPFLLLFVLFRRPFFIKHTAHPMECNAVKPTATRINISLKLSSLIIPVDVTGVWAVPNCGSLTGSCGLGDGAACVTDRVIAVDRMDNNWF